MGPRLFRSIFLGLSLLTLSKTENGITCREGSGVEDPTYCPSIRATWCEAVNGMQLVLVCSSCEGAPSVEWKYDEMKLNETTAQLTLPPDRVMSGCYRCSCKMLTERRFEVEARNAEKPFLMVPSSTVDGITYLSPQTHTIELTRNSTGYITVNCTAGGWPTLKVNWSSNALSPVSSDPCVFIWDDGFVLQKVIPMDPLEHGLTTTEYLCTLYNQAGTLTARQTIIYDDVSDYFLKPAQDLNASVEVGKEGYCAVYPEPGTTINYTVCLVPNNSDTEICPLIAHDVSHCCKCGSDCEGALGESVNISLGLTPADANWPGVVSCIVLSQLPLTLDCFAQRLSGEVTSLRQYTGSILYYDSSAPTNETSSAIEVDQKFIIALCFAIIAGTLLVCVMVMCMVITCVCVHRGKPRIAGGESEVTHSGLGEGRQVAADQLPRIAEDIKAKAVDITIVNRFVSKMAKKWEDIGIELGLGDLVANLRQPNCNVASNCTQVLQEAISAEKLPNYGALLVTLEHCDLSQVAAELLQAIVKYEREKEHKQQQPATDNDLQLPVSSSDKEPLV